MIKIRVDWDIEDEEMCDDEEPNLPEIVELPEDEFGDLDLDDYCDEVTDWLSDTYGYFVSGWYVINENEEE